MSYVRLYEALDRMKVEEAARKLGFNSSPNVYVSVPGVYGKVRLSK